MNISRSILSTLVIIFSTMLFTPSFAELTNHDFPFPFFLDHDATIQVPSNECVFCSHIKVRTIQDALRCLDNVIISPEHTVTIEMIRQPKEYSYDTIEIKHPNGDRINIVGKCSNNKNEVCTIHFKNRKSGVVTYSNKLGLLKNFHLIGGGIEENYDSGGVIAASTSSIQSVTNITVEKFKFGVLSAQSSYIAATNVVANNNFYGICASGTSSMILNGAVANNNEQNGIVSQINSNIYTDQHGIIEANNNGIYGVLVNVGGDIVTDSVLYANNNNVSDIALGALTTFYCSEHSKIFIGSHYEVNSSLSYVYNCWDKPPQNNKITIKTDLMIVPRPSI